MIVMLRYLNCIVTASAQLFTQYISLENTLYTTHWLVFVPLTKNLSRKHSGFEAYILCEQLCASNYYTVRGLSMTIIDDDDQELDRILENTNLDEYELIDVPIEQHSDSTQHNLGVGMAPISDTNSTSGLAPRKGGSRELRHGVDP